MPSETQDNEIVPSPFDRLTALICEALEAPFGLVSVLEGDQAVFRSEIGLGQKSLPRDKSVSARLAAMGPGATLIVPDALQDAELRQHPMVAGGPGIRFFAGATISDGTGRPVGAVGAMDVAPRDPPTASQMAMLGHIARVAGDLFDEIRARQAQAEQLALLSMAEEMAGLGHWRFDLLTGKVDWSDEVYRIHGRDRATFDPSYADVLADYHPDDRASLAACVERAMETGEGYNLELRLVTPTRGERRVTTRARTQSDETGKPVALYGVFQDLTETIRVQERLRNTEAQFRMVSETATDIIARQGLDGTILYASPSIHTILGYQPEALVGRRWAELTAAEDLARREAIIADYVKAGPGAPSPRYEYRAIRADGTTCWLEASPRALWDHAGQNVLELHDHVRDISERKAAERAQQELVDTLSLAGDMAGLGSWKLDVATGQVRWSDEVYRIHGVCKETFDPNLDDNIAFYHPDDRQAVRDWCARAIETGEGDDFQLRLIRADGEERVVVSKCRPERGPDGTTTALFGVFQDVTNQVRAEGAIRASEARYRLLADNSTDVIATYALDGMFRYLSPAIEALLGYKPEELIGRPFRDFMHPEDVERVQAAFMAYARAPAGTPSPRVAYRSMRKDGGTVWLEAHPKLIRDAAGRPVEFQDVVRDISETKALEDALVAARDAAEAGARAKSEFLANMSHELRTPLTSVIGFSGLLQASEALGDRERRYADRIATASDALLGVINDILDYSKLEAGAVDLDQQPFDAAKTIRSAADMIEGQCDTKGLTLTVEIEPGLPPAILGDEGRVRQVLLNFLSNAVKFTASGEIRLETRRVGDRLRVAVTDSGIGIAQDKIDSLFERFTQADASTTRVYGGTGLGLAISRRLIERMSGEIGVDSRPGEGSTFWFEIPMVETEGGASGDEAIGPTSLNGLKVLMADDAPANRELVRLILETQGIELDTVENGAEAVEAARARPYDLILMDVHMPVMDGMEASRALRRGGGRAAATPILALTANVQPEQVEACRQAGMDGHVGKPIQVPELLAAMARHAVAPLDQVRHVAA